MVQKDLILQPEATQLNPTICEVQFNLLPNISFTHLMLLQMQDKETEPLLATKYNGDTKKAKAFLMAAKTSHAQSALQV